MEDARAWPEGVGAAGQAFSTGKEIIVPDMTSNDLGTVYELDPGMQRDYDGDRYKSLAAVPVKVDGDGSAPWGVVIGTNDVSHHFQVDRSPSVRPVETVRALAGMVALGIAASRSMQTRE